MPFCSQNSLCILTYLKLLSNRYVPLQVLCKNASLRENLYIVQTPTFITQYITTRAVVNGHRKR